MEPNNVSSDIANAQREVERAKSDLNVRLRTASRSGKDMLDRTLHRTVQTTKPLIVAAASIGAGLVVMTLVRLARRRPRRPVAPATWLAPAVPIQPTLLGTLVRSALASAAASLASHYMARLSRALEESQPRPALPPVPVASEPIRPVP